MKYDKRAAFEQGIEVEQFADSTNVGRNSNVYPREVLSGGMPAGVIRDAEAFDWHRDLSGPQETSIGPAKTSHALLSRFYKETRDKGYTWDWHPSDDGGNGCGSHVHLHVADIFDDSPTAWSIAYNTVVELAPFFAPYLCHDWENGFRGGTREIERWASPRTTRYSPATVERQYLRPFSSRPFDSVLFNPPSGGSKPVTIELRMNDAFPGVALAGLGQIQRIAARAIEGGWSPKMEDRERTLRACYRKVYSRATEVGLLTAMQEPIDGGIRFEEGRGIPGVDKLEFETMFEVLRATQIAYPQTPNSWSCRVQNLIRAGRDEYGPQNNTDALWNLDAKDGEFYWDRGPVEHTNARDRLTTDDAKEAYIADAARHTVVATDGGER